MRRYLICGVLVLCACIAAFSLVQKRSTKTEDNGEKLVQQLAGSFDTTANISYKNLSATATITQQSPQACVVSFTEPESLKDMSFSFSRENVEVTYKGLRFGFDTGSIPGSSVANLVVSAINATLQRDDLDLRYEDGALVVSGVTEIGEFSLQLDSESGNLLKLSVPNEQLEIEFANFTFLQ